jgi:site-specific DNA recombinase
MARVQGADLSEVIVAKLDRLTRSVKDLCGLLQLFENRKVARISVAESLDTGSAAGRPVITIIGAVSQWEREAIGGPQPASQSHIRQPALPGYLRQ